MRDYTDKLPLKWLRSGEQGIEKSIHLGIRVEDAELEYLQNFIALAKEVGR